MSEEGRYGGAEGPIRMLVKAEHEVVREAATRKRPMTYASSVSVIVKGEVRVWALRYELQFWAFRLEWGLGFGP